MPTYQYQQGDRPLDGYTIQHALGRGGFGEVYFAVSDAGREVALKAVQNYEDIELRGIGHCMNLKSPHLVMIFDVKQGDDGTPWVIMEYVAGASLRKILDDAPSGLSEQQAAFFVRELAKGIDALHEAGIVHRDLKPHNVFFEDGFVKIGDYSLSKVITVSHASGHTMTVGSVHYMAPEISMGKYDKTVDIYALGVMLYEMLTGAPPYVGESVGEVLMKHLNGRPDVSMLPTQFADVVRKAMARDPGDRYQSARDMATDLKSVLEAEIEDSIPASLSLVGRSEPIDRGAERPRASQPPVAPVPRRSELADTIGPVPATEDTAESQRLTTHPSTGFIDAGISVERMTRRLADAHYLMCVGLSVFATFLLLSLAFFLSVDIGEEATVADAFVLPLGVWPAAMMLAMVLVLLVPKEKGFVAAVSSRGWLVLYWVVVYLFVAVFAGFTTQLSVVFSCFSGTFAASLLMDWRQFCKPERPARILIHRTLIAGAISFAVSGALAAVYRYGLDHVTLAMATTMAAAITVQLVSFWREPDAPPQRNDGAISSNEQQKPVAFEESAVNQVVVKS